MDNLREVRIRLRATGEVVAERVFGEKELRFLYENPFGKRLTHWVLRREPLNHVYGWFQRKKSSRKRIPEFVRKLGIAVEEAERPLEEYASLDDFFTRRLKPEARPIDRTPEHLISPADGRTLVYPRVEGTLCVKASEVTLEELLGDAALAERYRGGAAVVVRLAPADYHRFHFPEGGTASESVRLGRGLHSVHTIALEAGAPSFRNKRMLCRLSTEAFGELVLIEVGALIVGTMVQRYAPGRVERGQEKGYFRFGGSTTIVLAEPGRVVFDDDLLRDSADGLEVLVKMGSRIGRSAQR